MSKNRLALLVLLANMPTFSEALTFPKESKEMLLTVSKGLEILWDHHLKDKASARQVKSNLAALNLSMGSVCLNHLTELHIKRHTALRRSGKIGRSPAGDTTIRHDLKTLTLLLNMVRRWKRKRYTLNGVPFERVKSVEVLDLFDGIKKPRFGKRKRVALPNEFSRITAYSDPELVKLIECLIDTGARLQDALSFEPKDYNPYTDQIEWIQKKTGHSQVLPVSLRVKEHFRWARGRRKYVYDRINLRARWEAARKKAKILDLHLGRDFRKTTYNEGRRFTKDPEVGKQLMGHTSIRTGEDYYHVEQRKDLKPVIRFIENKFISRPSRRKLLYSPSMKKGLALVK